MNAELKLKMDRAVEQNKHYISPGGYEVTMNDGSKISFDFLTSQLQIDDIDPSIATIILSGLDTAEFPDAVKLYEHCDDIKKLSECFIYTGEPTDPEINVAQILNFMISDGNEDYNIELAETYCS